ncbi:MAG TPA: hypothetical protein VKY74_10085 [Chloroflexia bacterium]|nr:hypothetical protein [Chloroflexia bacterium]
MDTANKPADRPARDYEPTVDMSTWESGEAPIPAGRTDYTRTRLDQPADPDSEDVANSDLGNPGQPVGGPGPAGGAGR